MVIVSVFTTILLGETLILKEEVEVPPEVSATVNVTIVESKTFGIKLKPSVLFPLFPVIVIESFGNNNVLLDDQVIVNNESGVSISETVNETGPFV